MENCAGFWVAFAATRPQGPEDRDPAEVYNTILFSIPGMIWAWDSGLYWVTILLLAAIGFFSGLALYQEHRRKKGFLAKKEMLPAFARNTLWTVLITTIFGILTASVDEFKDYEEKKRKLAQVIAAREANDAAKDIQCKVADNIVQLGALMAQMRDLRNTMTEQNQSFSESSNLMMQSMNGMLILIGEMAHASQKEVDLIHASSLTTLDTLRSIQQAIQSSVESVQELKRDASVSLFPVKSITVQYVSSIVPPCSVLDHFDRIGQLEGAPFYYSNRISELLELTPPVLDFQQDLSVSVMTYPMGEVLQEKIFDSQFARWYEYRMGRLYTLSTVTVPISTSNAGKLTAMEVEGGNCILAFNSSSTGQLHKRDHAVSDLERSSFCEHEDILHTLVEVHALCVSINGASRFHYFIPVRDMHGITSKMNDRMKAGMVAFQLLREYQPVSGSIWSDAVPESAMESGPDSWIREWLYQRIVED